MTKKSRLLIVFLVVTMTLIVGAVALAKNNLPYTADTHMDMGMDCDACHTSDDYGDVPMETCLDCHGSYEELAKATSGTHMNPHDSHYIDAECGLCHHGHGPNEDFCASCHAPATTADKHIAVGVGCSACHGKGPAERGDVPMETCVGCHGSYDELADKTADLPLNPHISHFPVLECSECHKGHAADEDFCGQCH